MEDRGAGAGHIAVHDDVVMALAAWTALQVPGVAGLAARTGVWHQFASGAVRAVHVEHRADGIVLDVYLVVRYGASIPTVAEAVAQQVGQSLQELAGIEPVRITSRVVGVERPDAAP